MSKSGIDRKFEITFEVSAYEADLLVLLFQLLDREIEDYDAISNIESFDILISEIWHQIPLIEEYIKNGIGVEVSGLLEDLADFVRIQVRKRGT